jgi:hypothetical protein
MSENLAEWIVVGAFFFIIFAAMFAESFWLYKKGRASFGKSFVFSALSNFIGFGIGLFVFFVVMVVFMMFSLDGATQRIFDSRAGGAAAIAVLIVAALLTPFLLIICKRVLLGALKIQSGKAAWLYAFLSSVLILIVSLGVPFLIGYLLYR